MRKDQLIRALVRLAKAKAQKKPSSKSTSSRGKSVRSSKSSSGRATSPTAKSKTRAKATTTKRSNASARVAKKIERERKKRENRKDLAQEVVAAPSNGRRRTPVIEGDQKDRLVLMVRDSYWLHAFWEVSRHSVVRAKAALAEQWHTCQPVLRLFEVESTAANAAESIARDIPIHGGVKNWYIDVEDPPQSYRVELGYLAKDGRFYSVSRSNTVTTPKPGSSDAIDENWSDVAENYEKIYAQSASDEHAVGDLRELFEERLRRPMGSPAVTSYGVGAERLINREREFEFEVDAEMILFGKTKPDAHVALSGEPIKLRPDGTFTVRMSMPDRRQVLPVVASSMDGVEQRTVVLAVERNTKVMEPVVRESAND